MFTTLRGFSALIVTMSILLTQTSQAAFDKYAVALGSADYVEMKSKEELKRLSGDCQISFLTDSVIVNLGSSLRSDFRGVNVFLLKNSSSKSAETRFSLGGSDGERVVRGEAKYTSGGVRSSSPYFLSPGERFCDKLANHGVNYRSVHFLVGEEVENRFEISERDNTITFEESGRCNISKHRQILTCKLQDSERVLLQEFIDFQSQKLQSLK
jgi:hypothetical protein